MTDHVQQEHNQGPQQQAEAPIAQQAQQEAALPQGGPQLPPQQGGHRGGHQLPPLQMEKMVRLKRAVSALQRELDASRQREEQAEVALWLWPTSCNIRQRNLQFALLAKDG